MLARYGFIFMLLWSKKLWVNGEEPTYRVILDMIKGSEGFDNKCIDTGNIEREMKENEDTGDTDMILSGFIDLGCVIDGEVQMRVTVVKDTENGQETVFGFSSDFCETMNDEKMPHIPLLKGMNITSCPVEKGQYKLSGDKPLTISMSLFDALLNAEYEGTYTSTVCLFVDPTNPMSCHSVGLIVEEDN